MAGGRPRKPTHIKKAQGTLEKSREVSNPAIGELMSVLPAIPDGLSNDEEKYFIYCCEEMLKDGLLATKFVRTIERAAVWYGIWVITRRSIQEHGFIQKTKSGYSAITAELTAMEKSHKYLVDFETRFGLDLVSSQKINIPTNKKDRLLK